jgi:hypothetical protein
MREVRTGRDKTMPPPRHAALGPGERLIEGRVFYSSHWLNAIHPLTTAPAELPPERRRLSVGASS